jgi:hypothetical protein
MASPVGGSRLPAVAFLDDLHGEALEVGEQRAELLRGVEQGW